MTVAPVVLVGLDTLQGLQAARIFSKRRVPVIGVVSSFDHYTARTRLCDRVVPIGVRDVVDVLEEIGEGLSAPGFLLPCHDNYVIAVANAQDRLRRHFRISLPPAATVMELLEKAPFVELANRIGMAIPTSVVIRSGAEVGPLPPALGYPLAVKPSVRTAAWMSAIGEKAVRVEDEAALAQLLQDCQEATSAVIVQSWIEGDDADLYSCNGYFRDGQPLATFTARKLRQWPPRAGQRCLGEEVTCPEVLNETVLLARDTGYTGLLYVETKRDPATGRHFVIEPNVGRPTGRSAIAEAGGVELLMTAYADAMGLELPKERVQVHTGVKWIHILRDIRSAWWYIRRGELSLGDWLSSIRGRKVYAVWSLRDPLPFLYALGGAFRGKM